MTPQSIIDAAAGHISACETEGWHAEPRDAWECWDTCSLPQVPGLEHNEIRAMLAQEIERQLNGA